MAKSSGKSAANSSKASGEKHPYPWFGCKKAIAAVQWACLTDIDHLIIPFFGSGIELLTCPDETFARLSGASSSIIVNDLDCFIANFWRSIRHAEDQVAKWCDQPINQADMEAAHKYLTRPEWKKEIALRLRDDPEFFDPKAAGLWVYGIAATIGGDWCNSDRFEWHGRGDPKNKGHNENPLGGSMPAQTHRGVHRKSSHEGLSVLPYLSRLKERMREVTVNCSDWKRTLDQIPMSVDGVFGVILDPPYPKTADRADLYRREDKFLAHRVRDWAISHGRDPKFRIVLAGYDGQHPMPDDWKIIAWTTPGGMANRAEGQGKKNKARERLWVSPRCTLPDPATLSKNARIESPGDSGANSQPGKPMETGT